MAAAVVAPPAASADFYDDPSNPAAVAPGSVLRSRPSVFTVDPLGKTPMAGVASWQVLYRSTSATGKANAVSGTVLVPTAPWRGSGSRPLVSYAVGTRGLGDACAPSKTLATGTDYEGFFIAGLLQKGWAVAVSDYEGLGTPGQHTYVVGQSEGRAVLDMARAAQRLPGTGLSASTPVGLMGYSQGGGSAGWAAQLAGSYAPELKVKGTAAGGVPSDLIAVGEFHENSAVLALTLLAAVGFDAAYPELNLAGYLNDRGRELMARAKDMCLLSVDGLATLASVGFQKRGDYVTSDPLANPQWKARMAENKLGSIRPSAPVLLYHGVVDEMVPFAPAAELRRSWCNRGANVTWSPLFAEHVTGLLSGVGPAISFLEDRFNGFPVLGTCFLP